MFFFPPLNDKLISQGKNDLITEIVSVCIHIYILLNYYYYNILYIYLLPMTEMSNAISVCIIKTKSIFSYFTLVLKYFYLCSA